MVVNKNLEDEIPDSVLKSALQNQAAKGAASPGLLRKVLVKSGGLSYYIYKVRTASV